MNIRMMKKEDKKQVMEMMRIFYDSPAVINKASDEILSKDIDDCIGDIPFIEGYIFEEDNEIAGYSMIAKSYSTEYGGICVWIEDIYIKPEYQGRGYAPQFLGFIEEEYKEAVRLRLEVEDENERAVKAYTKCGYKKLPYEQMTKEI